MKPATAELFVEIRCEELPARFVAPIAEGLRDGLVKLLKAVDHGAVRVWATPRRVAVAIADVAAARPVETQLVTGPPAAAAWRDGAWTQAALGFARGRGVSADQLELVEGPKGQVVGARIQTGGESTGQLVAENLASLVLGIEVDRYMRWADGEARWARPIHGVVALLGGELLQCSIAGVASGRETLGHRLVPSPIPVTGGDAYEAALHAHFVLANRDARRAEILAQLHQAAANLGATVGALSLVDEVVDLVEWPSVIPAVFDADLLKLPSRLLVESMSVHQRVFPLFAGGVLLNRFLVVTNHPFVAEDAEAADIVAKGNTKVLASRFYDARFFYAEDRKKTLAEHGQGLHKMRWIRDGGTMADKQDRVKQLASALAPRFGADPARAARAGALCKSDLTSQMVGEFPELQGHVGRLLAAHDGEDATVAQAIEEHYLPRFSGDALPACPEGNTVAITDRLDSLVGCFTRGLRPKASADPLGLRRAAGGLVDLLLHTGVQIPLPELFTDAGAGDATADLVDFTLARFKARQAESSSVELIDAVLATGVTDVVGLAARIQALDALAGTPDFDPLKSTFKRLMNITGDHASTAYDPDALVESAEQALHGAFSAVASEARAASLAGDFPLALRRLSTLKAPVDRLFDEVMVMADDPDIRANRLGLLRAVADEFGRIADFKAMSS